MSGSKEKTFLIAICVAVALLLTSATLISKMKSEARVLVAPQLTARVAPTPVILGACKNFSKEEKSKKRWSKFFDRCIKYKSNKEKIDEILKTNGFQLVGERTHTSARLLSSDKECLNKALVFRIYYSEKVIDKYYFKYGLFAVD